MRKAGLEDQFRHWRGLNQELPATLLLVYLPGNASPKNPGEFGQQAQLYQQWAALPTDAQGRRYQAGVFWAGEACVIGFRRDVGLITILSEFMPHLPGPQI